MASHPVHHFNTTESSRCLSPGFASTLHCSFRRDKNKRFSHVWNATPGLFHCFDSGFSFGSLEMWWHLFEVATQILDSRCGFTKALSTKKSFRRGRSFHSLCKLQVIPNDPFKSLPVVELIYFHSGSFQRLVTFDPNGVIRNVSKFMNSIMAVPFCSRIDGSMEPLPQCQYNLKIFFVI